MSDYRKTADLVSVMMALERRVAALEGAVGFHRFTSALLPPASTMPGAVVFNTDLAKHLGSDGTSWNALY